MSNGNIKTKNMKTPIEWNNLLESISLEIKENGFPKRVYSPEIVRLLVHYKPARIYLDKAFKVIIDGFKGIEEVSPNVERWMKGAVSGGTK